MNTPQKQQQQQQHNPILLWLDYCDCLLIGTPNSVIQPLQKIQNFAARLVLLTLHHGYSTPLLEKLHWCPILEHVTKYYYI